MLPSNMSIARAPYKARAGDLTKPTREQRALPIMYETGAANSSRRLHQGVCGLFLKNDATLKSERQS